MKRWKKILLGLLVAATIAAGYGLYQYNKKPADVRTLTADYTLTANALLDDFNKDEAAANVKYLDKVIAVKGKVTEIKLDPASGQATVTLDSGDPMAAVTCSFYNEEAASLKTIAQGASVVIKGKCTGKLLDVVLNKCSVEK